NFSSDSLKDASSPDSKSLSPSQINSLRRNKQLYTGHVLRVFEYHSRFVGCSGSHADKILKIARRRDRVTASRMRQQLTLSNKRCCRVLDRHQPARESRLGPSPDQKRGKPVVERRV